MQTLFLSYKNSIIHYKKFGSGEKLLLCLHGFGETADSFDVFEPYLLTTHTVISFDLPFHGKTLWNGGFSFTIEDLTAIIELIPIMHNRRFSVMGFSMGGRVALQLYQHIATRIEKLILIAPDGLRVNIWYRLATQTRWGNLFFKSVMRKPSVFFAFAKALKKISLINTGVYNYIQRYLKDEGMRMRLYNIWTTMRKMKPGIATVRNLILQHHTPVVLIYGRYDKVIRFATGERFIKGVETLCKLHLLPTGHKLLQQKNSAAIAALL